jgi:hypothetical protein
MLVTCYYDVYHRPEKFIEYLYSFYDLGISGIPILLFTDPSLVYKFKIFPSTVKVIGMPLEYFELYSIGMSYQGELPLGRSPGKDTKEYLSLMNTKIEFILRASEVVEDDVFIWIDFGILKIVKDKETFLNKLRIIHRTPFSKITIPGCWSTESVFHVDSVSWRFCGGFFVIPRQYVKPFYNHSKNVLTDFCTMPMYKLTWETNVWYIVELCVAKDWIHWYLADHNDSILMNINVITNP